MTEATEAEVPQEQQGGEPEPCRGCGRVHVRFSREDADQAFKDGVYLARDIARGIVNQDGTARERLLAVFRSRGPEGAFWGCLGVADVLERKVGLRLAEDRGDGAMDIKLFGGVFDTSLPRDGWKPGSLEYVAADWASRFYRATCAGDVETAWDVFTSLPGTADEDDETGLRGMAIWSLLGTTAIAIKARDRTDRQQSGSLAGLLGPLLGSNGGVRGIQLMPEGPTEDGAGLVVNVLMGVGSQGLGEALNTLLADLEARMREEEAKKEDEPDGTEPDAGVRGPDPGAGPADAGSSGPGEAPEGAARA